MSETSVAEVDRAGGPNPSEAIAPKVDAAASRSLPIDQVKPSPANPRRHHLDRGIDELARSIVEKGILQPLLVRPIPVGATGDAVKRAAQRAGLEQVPVRIAHLDDGEALELALVENLQREDLHPLDEADGYKALHEQHRYTVEEIAARAVKSTAYVYARMKLCALEDKKAREAFLAGTITLSTALLIARVPNAKLQKEFAARILTPLAARWVGGTEVTGPLSPVEVAAVYRNEYSLRLEHAPFDRADPELVPKAGPCTTCPKRSGNQSELFADLKSPDVCTDTVCFAAKKEAALKTQIQKAKASGQVVLEGPVAAKVAPQGFAYLVGYVQVDKPCPWDPKGRTFGALLGKQEVERKLLVADGQAREVIAEREARRALVAAGHKWAAAQSSTSSKPSSTRSKANAAGGGKKLDSAAAKLANLAQAIEDKLTSAVIDELVLRAEKDKSSGKVLEVALADGAPADFVCDILQRRGFVKSPGRTFNFEAMFALLAKAGLSEKQLRGVFVEATVRNWENYGDQRLIPILATSYGVNVEQLRKKVVVELGIPRCRECGCTEVTACKAKDGKPCSWVEDPDPKTKLGLCSACRSSSKKPAAATGSGAKAASVRKAAKKKAA